MGTEKHTFKTNNVLLTQYLSLMKWGHIFYISITYASLFIARKLWRVDAFCTNEYTNWLNVSDMCFKYMILTETRYWPIEHVYYPYLWVCCWASQHQLPGSDSESVSFSKPLPAMEASELSQSTWPAAWHTAHTGCMPAKVRIESHVEEVSYFPPQG